MLFLLCPFKVSAISADAYIVMDMETKRVLGGRNIEKEKLIASITKIMTCYLAITYGEMDAKVKVDETVLKAYGSAIYIEIGEELTLKDLLYGLMLRSGNDAALMIAKNVSGSVEAFVSLMNATAKELGMQHTNFYNPHGLEENSGIGNTSTAYDMALLTSKAMKNSTYQEIVKTKSIKVTSSYKTYVWKNKNKLLSLYEYATGGKTGFTERARRTLVTTASNKDRNLVVVTLNDGNDFDDHITLYKTYYNEYNNEKILDKKTYKSADTLYSNYNLMIENDYSALLKKSEINNVRIVEKIDKKSLIKSGTKVGVAQVYLNDTLLHEEPIIAIKKKSKKGNIFKRIWRTIKLWLE